MFSQNDPLTTEKKKKNPEKEMIISWSLYFKETFPETYSHFHIPN